MLQAASSPCAVVIFGASGDLAKLKLIPALYELAREKLLSEKFALVGYARTEMSDDAFRQVCREAIQRNARTRRLGIDDSVVNFLLQRTTYCSGGYGDAAGFERLRSMLEEADRTWGCAGNRLFYISTPPAAFEPIIRGLGEFKLAHKGASGEANGSAGGTAENAAGGGSWQRVIIEKPFGRDLASAQALNRVIHEYFDESQVYRIDHYLGKETVQNLMVMRFANSIFEPIWNYKYIDHMQITVAETVNVDDRGGYYDTSGATRDMVQNHIFQLMALVAMEPPAALDATCVRDEKVKVYRSIRPMRPALIDEMCVRGQYGPGEYNGVSTPGYLKARGVAPDSKTETFVAMKLFIDNWRWSGMPFYLRTGKFLPQKVSEVVVRFRSPPLTLFQKQTRTPVYPNDLIIRVAPEEGISIRLNGKVPGGTLNIKPVAMDFFYKNTFKTEAPEAYERLIYDCTVGEASLFIRGDEAEAAWQVIDPIEKHWAGSDRRPEVYAPGTWGPKGAQRLIEADGRQWVVSTDPELQPILACAL
ncbi:MAG: glucose-6-phosphate dehydrogenase [Tepidisphaerales bacterium]